MAPASVTAPLRASKSQSRIGRLVRRNLDTDSEAEDNDNGINIDPLKPWMAEFRLYIDTHDIVPEGMSIVHWWGVSACFLFFFMIII